MASVKTSETPRRLVNTHQNDAVTFIETSAESGGARTFAILEIGPGGKVAPHYHRSYSETFTVTEGRMTITLDGVTREYGPGDEVTVAPGQLHAWSNPTGEPAVGTVELRPGQPGFEQAIRVAYGLANDGRVLKNGLPRNPLHTALLFEWGDGSMPGAYAVLERAFRLLARLARRRGVDRALLERYA